MRMCIAGAIYPVAAAGILRCLLRRLLRNWLWLPALGTCSLRAILCVSGAASAGAWSHYRQLLGHEAPALHLAWSRHPVSNLDVCQRDAFARRRGVRIRSGARTGSRGEAHPIEEVGKKLRAMMPWIAKNKLVDTAKN